MRQKLFDKMKKISTNQARLNRAVAKIKASKTGGCVLCGNKIK